MNWHTKVMYDKDPGRLTFLSRQAKPSPSGYSKQQNVMGGSVSGVIGGAVPMQKSSCTIHNSSYDDLSDFQLAAGKILFICQACYSGNTVNKMTKSK